MGLLRHPGRRWPAALLLLALAFAGGSGEAQAQLGVEYLVKGAYLFKFGDYVEWPGSALPKPGMPFLIGILGEDPFGPRLEELVKGHTIQGHPIQVKRYKRAQEVWDVQILFLGRIEGASPAKVVEDLEGLSILLVCDGDTYPGAVLKFVTQGNKVRFEADVEAADRRQLKLSSKLLSLARNVRPPLPPSGR